MLYKRSEVNMAESSDYKTFKKNMPKPGDRLDRVENVVGTGMPDVNFCSRGVECWIEMKSPKEPKRASTPLFGSNHKLSQDQKNWLLRQCRAGGFSYVLIATDKRWMLISGRHADDLNGLTVLELLSRSVWSTDKPVRDKENWAKLRGVLQAGESTGAWGQ